MVLATHHMDEAETGPVFTILIPVLFLVLFGSIYKSSSVPR